VPSFNVSKSEIEHHFSDTEIQSQNRMVLIYLGKTTSDAAFECIWTWQNVPLAGTKWFCSVHNWTLPLFNKYARSGNASFANGQSRQQI